MRRFVILSLLSTSALLGASFTMRVHGMAPPPEFFVALIENAPGIFADISEAGK